MNQQRFASAALALVGAAMAVPIPLAQIDFAGLVNVFGIDAGDTPTAVLVLAGAGGVATVTVIGLALAGAVLAWRGDSSARAVLGAAAIAGFVTAFPVWFGCGIVLGAAAFLARPPYEPAPAAAT